MSVFVKIDLLYEMHIVKAVSHFVRESHESRYFVLLSLYPNIPDLEQQQQQR